MNFLFFTPTVKSSAIARMAYLVARQLSAGGHHVEVISTEEKRQLSASMQDFENKVLHWSDTRGVLAAIRNVDIVVYQIGNSYEYHRGALEWISKAPGIVCLHDFFLGHLFYEWSKCHRNEADQALHHWYDAEIATRYFSFESSEQFIEITSKRAPMTEWICSKALAVVIHSDWDCGRVLRSCPGPVVVAPLPFELPIVDLPQKTATRDGTDFRILTFGHINPNKRVDSVIRAISQSVELRQQSQYRLVGRIEESESVRLSKLAMQLGVDLLVCGEVDDTELAMAIGDADVISCLRWPTLEAASGSAIEAMLHGKPIIVSNAGFYKTIPDTCALKISPEKEVSEVQSNLEILLRDLVLRESTGTSAKRWAEHTFTVDNYAQIVLALAAKTFEATPFLEAITLFSNMMQKWGAHAHIVESEFLVGPLRIFGEDRETLKLLSRSFQ